MGTRAFPEITVCLVAAFLLGSNIRLLAQDKPSPQPRPNFGVTLQLNRTHQLGTPKKTLPLAQRSIPSLLLSPSQWTEAVREFSLESKPVLMQYYWTGQPMILERHHIYYARSSLSYTKGIILKELGHGRMDVGIYKGRITLQQNTPYGMGPQPIGNPIVGTQLRLFRSSLLENVDKVFVMFRIHLTPRREETPPGNSAP